MKTILFILTAITALSANSFAEVAQPGAGVSLKQEFQCSAFADKMGGSPVGIRDPELYSDANKNLFIQSGVVYPGAHVHSCRFYFLSSVAAKKLSQPK